MISPLAASPGSSALIMVANRLTEGTSFDDGRPPPAGDAGQPGHGGLENGQLEQSLAELSQLKEPLLRHRRGGIR